MSSDCARINQTLEADRRRGRRTANAIVSRACGADPAATGTPLFYWAESEANPMVRTYWDALHYVSTALSVGYANIFPVTPLGKLIGAVVMTVGPAMSARALDNSPRATPEPDGGTALLAAKLDAILAELRRQNGG